MLEHFHRSCSIKDLKLNSFSLKLLNKLRKKLERRLQLKESKRKTNLVGYMVVNLEEVDHHRVVDQLKDH